VILFTGGTIAMRNDPTGTGAQPALGSTHTPSMGDRPGAQVAFQDPVDDPGELGGITAQAERKPAHRHRRSGLEQPQHVHLGRRQVELGRDHRHAGTLRHEQIEQELPGFVHLKPIIVDGADI